MKSQNKKEVVYKEQITNLLLLLLEIAGSDVKYSDDFEEALRKRLKFQKLTDWKKFRASVDLLDDTEYAIMSAFQYQLGDLRRKNKDVGEMYLRLYGILNAVYLQMNAYEELSKLLNYPKRNSISTEFQELDIYKLRGIAGSHTVNYLYDKQTLQEKTTINKTTSFRVIQMHLEETGSNITVLDKNNITFSFNLLKCLSEYEKKATQVLVELINHFINTLVYEKEQRIELKQRLNDLLPNLIRYDEIDKNKNYSSYLLKKAQRMVKEINKESLYKNALK